jgi:hypothetical protein
MESNPFPEGIVPKKTSPDNGVLSPKFEIGTRSGDAPASFGRFLGRVLRISPRVPCVRRHRKHEFRCPAATVVLRSAVDRSWRGGRKRGVSRNEGWTDQDCRSVGKAAYAPRLAGKFRAGIGPIGASSTRLKPTDGMRRRQPRQRWPAPGRADKFWQLDLVISAGR